MVSIPFDINLEENAHGTFAVAVSHASASNEVGTADIFPQESQNKRERYKNVRLTNITHTNTTGYRAYLKTVMNTLHTFQNISATQQSGYRAYLKSVINTLHTFQSISATQQSGYRAYLKTVMNSLHTFQSISATQLKLKRHVEVQYKSSS